MFTIYLIQYNANTAFLMVAAAFRAQSWYIRELVSKFVSKGVGSWVSEYTPSVYVDVIAYADINDHYPVLHTVFE